MYKVEAAIRTEAAQHRLEIRQAESLPLLDKLYARVTFLQSAKAVGANPYEYLHDVYNRIMAHPAHRLHELLPAAWMHARANQ